MNIRKYIESDKEYLRDICKKTADQNYQNNIKHLEILAIIYNDYFTENESDNIFVLADDNDIPVGYILCSTDLKKYIKTNKKTYVKKVFRISPKSIFIIYGIIGCLKKMRSKSIHLHIDILPEYQRQGYGTKLIDSLSTHLKEKGFNHLSVCAISRKSNAYNFYTKYGFKEIYDYGFDTVSLSIEICKQ